MNQELVFKDDWNGKLTGSLKRHGYFTTLRPSGRFKVGDRLEISLGGNYLGLATVAEVLETHYDALTLRQCALDTGYDVAETQAILKRMYPKLDSKTQPLYLYLLKWVAAEPKAEAPVAPSLNYTGLAIATFKETFKEYQIANNLEAYEIDFTQKSKETGHMRLLSERFLALLKSAAPPTNQPIEEATFKSRLKGFLSECLRQKAAGKWFASDFLPSRIYANFDLIITESRGYNKKVKEAAKAAHHQLEDYDAIELKK